MIICGCDIGKTGAIAFLDTLNLEAAHRVFDLEMLPDGTLDCFWLYNLLMEENPHCAIIEDVFRPKSLILLAGEFRAVCKLAGVVLENTPVVTWKKALLGENTSDKKRSIDLCQQLFPTTNINRPSPKIQKQVANADRAEALLLGEFLRRRLSNLIPKIGKKSKNI